MLHGPCYFFGRPAGAHRGERAIKKSERRGPARYDPYLNDDPMQCNRYSTYVAVNLTHRFSEASGMKDRGHGYLAPM